MGYSLAFPSLLEPLILYLGYNWQNNDLSNTEYCIQLLLIIQNEQILCS